MQKRIEFIDPKDFAPGLRHYIPGSVYRQGRFRYEAVSVDTPPVPAKYSGHYLPAHVQDECFQMVVTHPNSFPFVYFVTNRAADDKHRAFAAFIMNQHLVKFGLTPRWVFANETSEREVEDEMYPNPVLLKDPPEIVVIEGLDADSDSIMVEKVRDMLEAWDCPRVVLGRGLTPLELARKLRFPLTMAAHFGSPRIEKL